MIIQGGSIANKNGSKLESYVESLIVSLGLKYEKQVKYTGIYNKVSRMDFLLTDFGIAIEVKNQTGGGSVIEKIPYAIESLEHFPADKGILVLGDVKAIQNLQESFWKTKGAGCYEYAKNRTKGSNSITVLKYPELQKHLQNVTRKLKV